MTLLTCSADGRPIPAAADFPIGTEVQMTDCYGTVRWFGKVSAHAGPYSVTLDCGVTGSTSLLALPAQHETALFERLVRQILGLD